MSNDYSFISDPVLRTAKEHEIASSEQRSRASASTHITYIPVIVDDAYPVIQKSDCSQVEQELKLERKENVRLTTENLQLLTDITKLNRDAQKYIRAATEIKNLEQKVVDTQQEIIQLTSDLNKAKVVKDGDNIAIKLRDSQIANLDRIITSNQAAINSIPEKIEHAITELIRDMNLGLLGIIVTDDLNKDSIITQIQALTDELKQITTNINMVNNIKTTNILAAKLKEAVLKLIQKYERDKELVDDTITKVMTEEKSKGQSLSKESKYASEQMASIYDEINSAADHDDRAAIIRLEKELSECKQRLTQIEHDRLSIVDLQYLKEQLDRVNITCQDCDAHEKLTSLINSFTLHITEIAQLQEQIESLQKNKKTSEQLIQQQKTRIQDLNLDLKEATTRLKEIIDTSNDNSKLKEQIKSLQHTNRQLQGDTNITEHIAELETKLNEADVIIKNVRKDNIKYKETVASLEKQMEEYDKILERNHELNKQNELIKKQLEEYKQKANKAAVAEDEAKYAMKHSVETIDATTLQSMKIQYIKKRHKLMQDYRDSLYPILVDQISNILMYHENIPTADNPDELIDTLREYITVIVHTLSELYNIPVPLNEKDMKPIKNIIIEYVHLMSALLMIKPPAYSGRIHIKEHESVMQSDEFMDNLKKYGYIAGTVISSFVYQHDKSSISSILLISKDITPDIMRYGVYYTHTATNSLSNITENNKEIRVLPDDLPHPSISEADNMILKHIIAEDKNISVGDLPLIDAEDDYHYNWFVYVYKDLWNAFVYLLGSSTLKYPEIYNATLNTETESSKLPDVLFATVLPILKYNGSTIDVPSRLVIGGNGSDGNNESSWLYIVLIVLIIIALILLVMYWIRNGCMQQSNTLVTY